MPLEPDKFVYLATRENGSDPARGGLVRPLAWLHCFLNVNIKDLLSFIESYAMPGDLAKVSDSAFESEPHAFDEPDPEFRTERRRNRLAGDGTFDDSGAERDPGKSISA